MATNALGVYDAQVKDSTAAAVGDALGLGGLIASPNAVTRGAMGEIWRVRTERGAWAVKALFPWAEYPPLPRDVHVQSAALEAGIALPRPVVHNGIAVVTVESRLYRAYEWIDFAAPLRPPVPAHVATAVGRILGAIHRLPVDIDEPVDDWYTTAPEPLELLNLTGQANQAGTSWGPQLKAALPLIEALRQFEADDHASPRLCHRDFNASNVLPAAETTVLVTLDWENVGPLAPDEELADALLAWCSGAGAAQERSTTAFLEGYRAAGGSAVIHPERSFSMAVCTALNFLRVMAEQALRRDEHLAFAEAQLQQLLESSLADLLTAIRSASVLAS